MYQQFEGSFDSVGTILPMVDFVAKMGPKNQTIKQEERELNFFIPFDLSRRASHFSVFVCQNWMKNGKVMTMRSARAKVALAILGHKMAILATFF